MVQLQLEALGGSAAGAPEDIYLSVRVGEVQKLSRLSGLRVYRFPSVGDSGHGRIDVFRRIGTASLDVDPANAAVRDVKIKCLESSGFGPLELRVAVGGDVHPCDLAQKPPTVEADASSSNRKCGSKKVQAAKEYLGKHGIEMQLSEAMQAVLRERPEEPAEFLAARLLAQPRARLNSKGSIRLQPLFNPPERNTPLPTEVGEAPQRPSRPRSSLRRASTDGTISSRPGTAQKGRRERALPFKTYYEKNFISMGTTPFQRCYARFSCSCTDVTPSVKVSSAKTSADVRAGKVRLLPSCGTWMQARPWRDGNKGTGMLAKDHTSLEKPPSEPLPPGKYRRRTSVGTLLAPRRGMARTTAAAQALPSANTDLQENKGSYTPHLATDVGAPVTAGSCSEQRAAAPAVQCSAAPPCHKPSMGTWKLTGAKLRLQQHILAANALSASTDKGKVDSKHETHGATAVATSPSTSAPTTFRSLPSVGTWQSAPSMMAEAVPVKDPLGAPATDPPEPKLPTDADWSAQDSCHSCWQPPSIGTWLALSAAVSDSVAALTYQEHLELSKKGNKGEQLFGSMQLAQPDTSVFEGQLLPIPGKADVATENGDVPCVHEQNTAGPKGLMPAICSRQASVDTWIVSPPTQAAVSPLPQGFMLPDSRMALTTAPGFLLL